MTSAERLTRAAVQRGKEDGAFLVAAEALRRYEAHGVHQMVRFLSELHRSEGAVRAFVKDLEMGREPA